MVEDYVLAICNVAFCYALIPQIIKHFKDKKVQLSWQTLIINVVGLTTMCGVFISLNLWLSCLIMSLTASMWLMMLAQKIIFKIDPSEYTYINKGHHNDI